MYVRTICIWVLMCFQFGVVLRWDNKIYSHWTTVRFYLSSKCGSEVRSHRGDFSQPQVHIYCDINILNCSQLFTNSFLCASARLTLGRRHRSCARGRQTPSWLRWPQAGSTPDWDIASAGGGRSHSPPSLWDCPSWTSVSCNLPNSEKHSTIQRF